MIEFGFPFMDMHWHYWMGVGVCVIINLLIGINQYLHHNQKWLYFVMPILFGVIIYFSYGIVSGWFV